MFDETFSLIGFLSETEESTLYYMSGYFALKKNIAAVEPADGAKAFKIRIYRIIILWQIFTFSSRNF